jgi:hypothetical protein
VKRFGEVKLAMAGFAIEHHWLAAWALVMALFNVGGWLISRAVPVRPPAHSH